MAPTVSPAIVAQGIHAESQRQGGPIFAPDAQLAPHHGAGGGQAVQQAVHQIGHGGAEHLGHAAPHQFGLAAAQDALARRIHAVDAPLAVQRQQAAAHAVEDALGLPAHLDQLAALDLQQFGAAFHAGHDLRGQEAHGQQQHEGEVALEPEVLRIGGEHHGDQTQATARPATPAVHCRDSSKAASTTGKK